MLSDASEDDSTSSPALKRQATDNDDSGSSSEEVNGSNGNNGSTVANEPSAEVMENRLIALSKLFPKKVRRGRGIYFWPRK